MVYNHPMTQYEKDELIYRGRVLELHKVTVRTKQGKLIERDLVHYNGAAVILPLLADGRIVLIRNYRYVVGEYLYELPAGNVDRGEDPEVTAARELTEETGYQAGKLEKLGAFLAAPGTSDEVLHSYLATDLRPGRQALEEYEDIAAEAFEPARLKEMVREGTVYDAKTIATLALYWLRQEGAQ